MSIESLQVIESDSAIEIDTGPLTVSLLRSRFNLFHNVRLHGVTVIPSMSSAGFVVMTPKRKHFASVRDADCEVSVSEKSDDQVTVVGRGRHCAMPGGTGSLLAWAVRLTVGRGASHAVVEYEAVNDETNEVGVRGIGYAFRAAIGAVDKGLIWTAEGEFPLPDEGRELLYEEPVARPSPNWICWRGPRGGLAIAIKEMGRKAPKALRVRPSGYSIGFLPERAMDGAVGGAVTLQPGEAIRDTALFYFVGPTTQRQQVADDIQSICPS